MESNINMFSSAYFGKPYKTRDNKKAIYHIFDGQYHRLITEERCDFSPLCDDNGRHLTHTEGDSPFDIISDWHEEEINEEELDEFAEHWCPESGSYREGDIETQRVIRNAYKAGYRNGYYKAKGV